MKKVLLTVLLVLGLSSYAAADTKAVAGAKLDAPNLVRISDTLTLGVEVGKDLINNPFVYDQNTSYIEDDRGYFGYVKVTYTGSLLDLSK